MPRALQWDHNAYYHDWLLDQIPRQGGRMLDVGCGHGVLARRLAERAEHVDAIDASPVMIDQAKNVSASRGNIRWILGDVLQADLHPDGYDVVTAVSSLHHLPLRDGLTRLAGLVRPNGVLVVIGHYRAAKATDKAMEIANLAGNAAMGAYLAARGKAGKPHDDGMPIKDPKDTLAEIQQVAGELMPGVRIQRRMYWRYSLLWRRPGATY
ncbi:class I SAM-dependent methyltransferase [Kribbella deserti]|uniref:Class I SAM-dependent methyltransferase n=1 Tax=Kribbella deserti TaxID=1926257 RepID=A0ABV6QRM8_9ACTN